MPTVTNGSKTAFSFASCLPHYTIPFLTLDIEGRGESKKIEGAKKGISFQDVLE